MPKIENETGSISGYLKGINTPGNSNMAGWKIYIDSNNDGKLQENKERFVVTDNNGYYEFKDLKKGDYSIKIIMKPNWEQIKPNNNYYDININNGQNIVNLDFENKFLKGNNKK
ncbi:prealbumin-like fold domain-containing protein [Candidatus Gracilibacteria bacterium]|nr:prealbumin-like fold domain-containing protein [Candidatus Gracilibacteria bacterium]